MKRLGLFDMLQLAAGFSMAGPMFFMGLSYLRLGRFVGGAAFLVLGALALYFPTYLVNRIGGPRTWIRRRFGGGDGESDVDADPDHDSDAETADRSSGPLERLRRR